MVKLTPKQLEYTKNATHRWNVKTGAVRSGKSFVDTACIIPERIIERIHDPGLSVIIGVTKNTLERNVLQPMREIYGPNRIGIIRPSDNVANIFGEKVYCLGAEKISQVAKIQGASFKYVYGDEVAKWNKEVFEMVKSRMDKPRSCFDGACNPENPTHFFKEFLDSKADIYVQHYTIFDNPYLPAEFVDNLCREYEGSIYYDRLILGLWKRAEGAIYRRFADNPEKFLRNPEKGSLYEIVIGVDFGGNNSGHSFVARGYDREGNVYGLMSIRHMNKDFSQGIDANVLEELLIKFIEAVQKKYGEAYAVYWDNAETTLGQSIRNAVDRVFPSIIVRPALKKRIKDRIDCTVRLMGAGRFFITEDCETLSKALQDAVYNSKSQADERLDDGSSDIDTLDAFEYTIERDIDALLEV